MFDQLGDGSMGGGRGDPERAGAVPVDAVEQLLEVDGPVAPGVDPRKVRLQHLPFLTMRSNASDQQC